MKKLLTLFITGIFLFVLFGNFVSALDFDKKVIYSNEDLKATIEDNNFLGVGELLGISKELGSAELKSHKEVDEIKEISSDQLPMYYEFDFKESYKEGLGKVTFYNVRTGKKEDLNYSFVLVSYEDKKTFYPGTNEVVGTYRKENYVPYDSKDIPSGKEIIGIKVEGMKYGIIYDGVWTIAGKEITRHAQWTYTGDSYSVNPPEDGGSGLAFNGTDWIVVGFVTGNFSVFNQTWNYTGVTKYIVDGSAQDPTGIFWNETEFLVTDNSGDSVRRYWGNLTSIGSFSTASETTNPQGIDTDGNYWYVGDGSTGQLIYRYFLNGTYSGTSYNISSSGVPNIFGLTKAGNNFYTTSISSNISVYEFDSSWTYTGNSYNASAQNSDMRGITYNSYDNYFYLISPDSDLVYKYEGLSGLQIDLIEPTNGQEFSTNNLNFSGNVSSIGGAGVGNVSLYIDGILNQTNSSNFIGLFNFNTPVEDGSHNYSYVAYDNSTNIFTSSVYTFTIDSTSPSVNITYPLNSTNTTNYTLVNAFVTYLNYTASDVNLDSCWLQFNGSNTSLSACGNTSLAINYSQYPFIVWANDTYGNYGSDTLYSTWEYKILELNKTYNASTIEGQEEEFYLYMNRGTSSTISSAILHYPGVTDTSSLTTSGNNVTAFSDIIIPVVTNDTNNTFYWTITLSDGTIFNTTNATQLVLDTTITNCSSGGYPFLFMYLKDEEERTLINGTIETSVNITNPNDSGQVANFSGEFLNTNNASLCSPIAFNSTNFLADIEIRYEATNYESEFYHTQRNNLSSSPFNISLFDLLSTDSTRFKVLYRGENLIGVEGAIIQLQRKYISTDTWEVVEAPLTSSESSTIVHIDTNTNKYQAVVTKDGEILGFFENLDFICQSELTGECTFDLFENLVPPNLINLDTQLDFSYYINTSTANQTITINYAIPSGTNDEILVLANQTGITGTSTICNQSVTSSSGGIECSYNTTIEDSEITFTTYKNGDLVVSKSYIVKSDVLADWEGNNYWIVVVLLLSLVFMALSSPEWMVVNAILVLMVAGGTWLINGMDFVLGVGSLLWLIFAGAIIIKAMSKQEDR